MKTLVLTACIVVSLFACVSGDGEKTEESTPQALCTEEDQQSGVCDGPAGGWQALQQHTLQYAQSQAPGPAQMTTQECGNYPSGGSHRTWCHIELDFGQWTLVTICEDNNRLQVNCTSWWEPTVPTV